MIGVIGFSLERSFMGFAFKKESQLRNIPQLGFFLGIWVYCIFFFAFIISIFTKLHRLGVEQRAFST